MLAASRIMTLLGTPMLFGATSVAPDAAVGIAMFPRHGKDAGELLQRAKHALHNARGHRDRVWLYVEPESSGQAVDQLEYENRLRSAIEQNRLHLYFQPQADIRTRRIIGAEALLRWDDDALGFVPPSIAIKAAEDAGLIDHLTMWVITSGIQSCAEFRKIDPHFHISINISPSNLREVDLPYYVDRALRTWNVPGENIMIEITESAMMVEQTAAHEALHQLKTHGVKLSVDDFGTGYSSMYYLAQLPLDELKIDIMFVKSMLESPQHAKIVRSLIDLAHNLELMVVAEGVESEEILAALAHLGCDIAQGYHVGKPLSVADLTARLAEQSRRSA